MSGIETRIYRLKKEDKNYFYLYLPQNMLSGEGFPLDMAKPLKLKVEGARLVVEQGGEKTAAPDDLIKGLENSRSETTGYGAAGNTKEEGISQAGGVRNGKASSEDAYVYCHVCGMKNSTSRFFCRSCKGNLDTAYDLPTYYYQSNEAVASLNSLIEMAPTTEIMRLFLDKLGTQWVEAQLLGNAVRVSDKQYPELYHMAEECARILAVPRMPKLYVSQKSVFTAGTSYSIGTNEDPVLVLDSFIAGRAAPAEFKFIVGREMGHIKCGHPLCLTVGELSRMLASAAVGFGALGPLIDGIPGGVLGSIIVNMPFKAAMNAWNRAAHYTADKAGLLVVRDIGVVKTVFSKYTASWIFKDLFGKLDFDELLAQADEIEESVGKYSEYLPEVQIGPLGAPREFNPGYSVPFTVKRLKALLEFIETPDYKVAQKTINSFLNGEYKPPEDPVAESLYCGQCGSAIPKDGSVCGQCGATISP